MATDVITVTEEGIRIVRPSRCTRHGVRHSRLWYLRRWYHGRPVYFPLSRNFQRAARRAREIDLCLRELRMPFEEVRRKYGRQAPPGPVSSDVTVGTVLDFLEAHGTALALSERTVSGYVRSLLKVVRVAREYQTGSAESEEKARELPLTSVDHGLASDFKKALVRPDGDHLNLRRTKRTVNSVLRNAKAVFSKRLCDEYLSAGLNLPDMDGFLGAAQFAKVTEKYSLPDRELITAVMTKINTRDAVFSRNAWIAASLASHAGLRKNEISFARRAWFSADGGPHVTIRAETDFEPKGGRARTVPLPNWLYDEITAGLSTNEGPYVLTGGLNDRKDVSMREVTRALRSLGINAGKPLHELRKWFGSFAAYHYSLTKAQGLLGHSSHQTTCDYYADLSFDATLAALWTGTADLLPERPNPRSSTAGENAKAASMPTFVNQ